MKTKPVVTCGLILALLACSCQPGEVTPSTPAGLKPTTEYQPAPTPSAIVGTSVPVPTATPVETKRTVIMVALDGARPDWTAKYMEDGTMPNLATLARRGVMATEGLRATEPVLPIPTYLALSTGRYPALTGLASTGLPYSTSSTAQPTGSLEGLDSESEPLWRTAMRNGQRTATVFWPVASLDDPDLSADYMVATVESNIPSAEHAIALQDANGWDNAPPSFSPLHEGALRIASREGSTVATMSILAIDDQDDGVSLFNRLLLDSDKDLTNGYTELRLGGWTDIVASPRLHSGTRLCFTASGGITVTLYQSRVCYNQGHPTELLQAINEQFGFPPPPPDHEALRAGWLSPRQYGEMAARRAEWMGYVVLYVYQTYAPDLLLTAQTIIADSAKPFLLVDGRQEGYGPEKAELYAELLAQAHAVADENLKNLLELADLTHAGLFVISTHGLAPVHTTVRLNTILSNAKLLQVKTGATPTQVDTSKSAAWAATMGGIAHIYINLQGREWPGVVAPEDYAKTQDRIMAALQESKDETGQPVFARILKGEELDALHMSSPNAGDVFAQAAPGYYLSDELGARHVLGPAPLYAADGFEASIPDMYGVFIAAGDGLLSGKIIPSVSILDIAPTVAQALRFRPAAAVQGHAIEGIWR